MKKTVIIVLFALVFVPVLLLSGCSGVENPSDETGTVRLPTDNAYIGITNLGVSIDTTASDNPQVADAVRNRDGDTAIIRAFAAGKAKIVFTDFVGRSASASVEVGSDGKIISCSVEPFPGDENTADVRLFGATGNGGSNDTAAIQSAIDSFGESGGTVYIPAGRYRIDRLILRENVSVVMQGDLGDAKDGFTDELAARINGGEFAVLVDNLTVNNLLINHNPGGSGRNGAGNVTIKGGVVDLNGATVAGKQIDSEMTGPAENGGRGDTCACVFSCASGLTVENVIFKDSYNGHGFQICGAENVTIKNCLFAGFTIHSNKKGSTSDLTLTRETIQIEYAHSGAIPPSSFRTGEYYHCKNVEITGCCFTCSDKAGYILVPIGQHGMNGAPNCTGLKITDNVFDNPYLYGIHLLSYEDVEITGNSFISTKKNFGYSAEDCTFILCNLGNNGNYYQGQTKQGNEITVTYCNPWENRGTHNVKIENNEFRITGNSFFKVMVVSGNRYDIGATTVSGQIRQQEETLIGVPYTGFLPVQNVIDGFSFINNTVTLGGSPSGGHNIIEISNVRNLTFSGNSLSGYRKFSKSYEGFQGAVVGRVTNGKDAVTKTVVTSLKDSFLVLEQSGSRPASFSSDGEEHKIILQAGDGVSDIELDFKHYGDCHATAKTEDGFEFVGWFYENGEMADGTNTVSGYTVLTAVAK